MNISRTVLFGVVPNMNFEQKKQFKVQVEKASQARVVPSTKLGPGHTIIR